MTMNGEQFEQSVSVPGLAGRLRSRLGALPVVALLQDLGSYRMEVGANGRREYVKPVIAPLVVPVELPEPFTDPIA